MCYFWKVAEIVLVYAGYPFLFLGHLAHELGDVCHERADDAASKSSKRYCSRTRPNP